MKVAVICREHPDHFGGGFSIAAWNTAKAARDAGVDVTYITAERPDGFCNVEVRDGVRVIWMTGTTNTDYPLFLRTILAAFPTYHKQLDFDLVHGHGYSAASLAKKGLDVPILFHDHGSKCGYVQTFITDTVLRKTSSRILPTILEPTNWVYYTNPDPAGEPDFVHMRRYDKVLATSLVSLIDFRTRYFLTNAVPFYHCIYGLEKFSPCEVSTPPVVAVFAGNLDNLWKVGEHFLSMLLPLKDKIRLLMIGKGPSLYEFAKTRFPNLEYTGHLLEPEAMKKLWGADVLFEPSTHHIGLNLTGISAIGLGVPVVAFPTAGHYDLIGADSEAGILVDPVDGDVCSAITQVFSDRSRYVEGAYLRFDRIFSPRVCSKRIKAIYDSAVGG